MRFGCRRGAQRLFLAAAGVVPGLLCAPAARGQQNTPINLPPLNGFQPLVVFGMSDEEWGGSDFDLKGFWNSSMLTARSGSVLPNIVGSPVVGLYQVQIKNSQPTHVTLGSTTYKSPLVSMVATNTMIPSTYGKVTLTTTNNVGGPPAY